MRSVDDPATTEDRIDFLRCLFHGSQNRAERFRRLLEANETRTLCNDGEWRSLVAHLLWEQRVAGSNPVSPTTLSTN